MSWQMVRGPSGKVCFELDAARGLVRLRHNKDCTDIVDLTAYGLYYAGSVTTALPDFGPARTDKPIDFSPAL